ncbi:hypothetical protein GEMRC1_005296 [Eukaryota sp. GEM-RC1]
MDEYSNASYAGKLKLYQSIRSLGNRFNPQVSDMPNTQDGMKNMLDIVSEAANTSNPVVQRKIKSHVSTIIYDSRQPFVLARQSIGVNRVVGNEDNASQVRRRQERRRPRCSNCNQEGHYATKCLRPCGKCGDADHKLKSCPAP